VFRIIFACVFAFFFWSSRCCVGEGYKKRMGGMPFVNRGVRVDGGWW
jgi:hypothetical protein